MGFFSRVSGWDQQKEAHNAVLANDLIKTINTQSKRRIAAEIARIHHRIGLYQNRSVEDIMAIISDATRIEQLNFIAIACITTGIAATLPGVEFFPVRNPYQANNTSSLDRLGVAKTDLSRRAGRLLDWPGNETKIDFSTWVFKDSLSSSANSSHVPHTKLDTNVWPTDDRLNPQRATNLAHRYLLLGLIEKTEIIDIAEFLCDTSNSKSNYEVALISSRFFFESSELVARLNAVQMGARMLAVQWMLEGHVSPDVVSGFEASLYEKYKQ